MESRKLSLRVSGLEAFLRFLNEAQTEIRYSSLPVEQVVSGHTENLRFLTACAEALRHSSDFPAVWRQAVEKEAKSEGFSSKDLSLLRGFGASFGSTDMQGQLSHFSLYTAFFQSSLTEAKEAYTKKARLYRMLGVFGGLAVSLILY